MSNHYLAAIDVGGTKADAVLFRETGEIVARVVDPAGTPFDYGLEATLEMCRNTLEKLLTYADAPVRVLYASIATVEYYMDSYVDYFNRVFPQIGKIRRQNGRGNDNHIEFLQRIIFKEYDSI